MDRRRSLHLPLGCLAVLLAALYLAAAGSAAAQARADEAPAVGLVWETDTYTPPLYRGKALYTPGAAIRLIALPPAGAGYRYSWRVNDSNRRQASPDNTLTLKTSSPRYYTVRVIVSDRRGEEVGRKTVRISPAEPAVSIHRLRPDSALGYRSPAAASALSLAGGSRELVAVPWFFAGRPADLDYRWSRSGAVALSSRSGARTAVTPVSESEEAGGSGRLEVEAKQPGVLFQHARQHLRLNF